MRPLVIDQNVHSKKMELTSRKRALEASSSDALLEVAFGRDYKTCIFDHVQAVPDQLSVIINALFPPSRSVPHLPHRNTTSTRLKKFLHHFWWNDVYPFCHADRAKHVDQDILLRMVTDGTANDLVYDMWRRCMTQMRIEASCHCIPIVVWAGATVNLARQRLLLDGAYVSRHETVVGSFVKVVNAYCPELGMEFISIEDAVHPSFHLLRQSPEASEYHRTTWSIVEVIRANPSIHDDPTQILERIDIDTRAKVMAAVASYDRLGIPHVHGWLAPEYRALRLAPWHVDGCTSKFQKVVDLVGLDTFLIFVQRIDAFPMHIASDDDYASKLRRILGVVDGSVPLLTSLMDGSFSKLVWENGHAFIDKLERLKMEWGLPPKKISALMCGGLACRFLNNDFWGHLLDLYQFFDADGRMICTVMCGGMAKMLDEHSQKVFAFLKMLREDWKLSTKKICAFLCGGVLCRVTKPEFLAALDRLRAHFDGDAEMMCTVMCGGMAKMLDDQPDEVFSFLKMIREDWKLSTKKMCAFLCDGILCRVTKPEFLAALNRLRAHFDGDAEMICTAMCDSFAKMLDEQPDEVFKFFDLLRDRWKFSTTQIQLFVCGGLMCRVTNKKFVGKLERLLNYVGGSPEMMTCIMSDSVAKQLDEDPGTFFGFLDMMRDDWLFSLEQVCSVMTGGLASRIRDPTFINTLGRLFKVAGSPKAMVSMMNGSVVKIMDERTDDFFHLLEAWYRKVPLSTWPELGTDMFNVTDDIFQKIADKQFSQKHIRQLKRDLKSSQI